MSAGELRRPDRWPDADHTDIVIQLRVQGERGGDDRAGLLRRAADEIERLRSQQPRREGSR